MRLYDLLRRGAAISPDKTAITHGKRSITFHDLLTAADKLGRSLQSNDLPPDSRVAVLCENSVEYVIFFFAALRAGFVVVPLDTSLKPDKLQYILDDCQAKILLIQAKYARFLPEMISADSGVERIVCDKVLNLDTVATPIDGLAKILNEATSVEFDELIADIDTIAPLKNLRHDNIPDCPRELTAIFYTSGSTGTPKGVMLSHRNLLSNTVATVEYLKLTQDDAIMCILPLYYIYGNSLLLTHLLIGARVVIDNRFAFPQVILQTMAEEKVTGFSGVPSNFMILLNLATFDSKQLPDLRYLTQAGGAMAPEVIRKLMAAFPNKEIFIMYGQTEASPRVTWLPPDRLKEKVGSIGIPVPGVDVRVAGESAMEMPVGDIGEIVVSGDCVMLGYWNQPDEQTQVLRNGRLFTGDLARRDEDGYIYVVSRKKEIIKAGGNRVSAKEIEERILENDKVLEVAVFGVEDEVLGEAIKAVMVLKESQSASIKEIQEHVALKLARHKIPKYIDFVESLPKYQSGKVNKLALTNPELLDSLRKSGMLNNNKPADNQGH